MNKILNKIRNIKFNAYIFIFIIIIFISIVGLQTSKIYAQNTKLDTHLYTGYASISNSLTVAGSVGLGTDSSSYYKLSVGNNAEFSSVIYGKKPNKYQLNALVTVGFVDDAIANYVTNLNNLPNPAPPSQGGPSCTFYDSEVQCYFGDPSSHTYYSLNSCGPHEAFKYFTYSDFSPGAACELTTICCDKALSGATPASSFNPYTIY